MHRSRKSRIRVPNQVTTWDAVADIGILWHSFPGWGSDEVRMAVDIAGRVRFNFCRLLHHWASEHKIMKWRIIINMSLTGRRTTALRNAIGKCFKQCGITPIKQNSHSWEGTAVSPKLAAEQLNKVFAYLTNPKANNYRGELDILSIYIDRAKNE